MKAKLLRRQKSTSEIENRVEQEEESEYFSSLGRLKPKPILFWLLLKLLELRELFMRKLFEKILKKLVFESFIIL